MFLKRVHIVLLFMVFAAFMLKCSGYEKLLKSRDYKLKYEKALEYYNQEEYVKAAALFDQIAPVYRGTIKADTVFYYQAQSYYMQRDYIIAGHYFQSLAADFPNSTFAEEADFLTGYCFYKLSPKPSLDQQNTLTAISTFQLFMIRYPSSEKVKEAISLIEEMRNKLVEKSYMSAKLYFNLGDYKAASIALRNSLNEFPDTKYREELMFLLLKSTYLLADKSIPTKRKERFQNTIDEYYSFIGEFPASRFRKEAERIYEISLGYAGNMGDNL